jgi:hypothetical protein
MISFLHAGMGHVIVQKLERVAMQAVSEKDFSPYSQRNVVRVSLFSLVWENKGQAQNVYELGFIVVDQLVLLNIEILDPYIFIYT